MKLVFFVLLFALIPLVTGLFTRRPAKGCGWAVLSIAVPLALTWLVGMVVGAVKGAPVEVPLLFYGIAALFGSLLVGGLASSAMATARREETEAKEDALLDELL